MKSKITIFLAALAFSTAGFAAPKMVKNIICKETKGDAQGSRLSILVNLNKKINPVGNDVLYGLKGDITLLFREDVAKDLKVNPKIEKKNLVFEKEHAMYTHELSATWEPQGVNGSVSRLALLPIIENTQFTGEWAGELFESTITENGLSIKADQFTGEPGLICQAVD